MFILSLLFTLIVALTFRQAFSGNLASHPGNHRALIEELSIERGTIYADNGQVLAKSKLDNGIYSRVYPGGAAFAPVTGYSSPSRGRFGLEASQTQWLAARTHFRSFDDWWQSLAKKKRRGFDLKLTIRPGVQSKAWDLLAGHEGSVVALDPKTGSVLALVSRPSYDPNTVESHWAEIVSTDGMLINRASQGLYPPGSIFKIVTTASALDSGLAKPSTVYEGPAVLRVHGSKVTNFAGQDYGRMSLSKGFVKSTNTIFAQVGLDLGAKRLVDGARSFGWNQKIPFDLPVARSSIPAPGSMDQVMVAWTAVGQGRTLATPLQMALVAAGVAERGRIYQPFIVDSVTDDGKLVYQNKYPSLWKRATTPETAARIRSMMKKVVRSGTGMGAAIEGMTVAGKTGTAELGPRSKPHAWFIGFAPADDPKIAVAVILEHGGFGGREAAPIAREIFRTFLDYDQRQGL